MTTKALSIDLIRTDGGTQMRAELDKDVYFDYRDKWLAGVEFDPVVVFHDGSAYWLADGFHRFYGAREAKRSSIPCDVRQGTQREAILFATGANAAHGLRRTNADKRQAVMTLLNDEEWVTWSDNKIAEQAAVSDMLVRDVRKQLQDSCSSPAAQSANAPRVGKDGKKRRPPKRKPKKTGPAPAREPGEDPVESEHVAPEIVSDSFGAVSLKLVPIFSAVTEFKGIQNRVGAVQNDIEDLQRSDAGAGLPIQEILNAFKVIKHGVKFAVPYCECPKCRRSKKACDTCEGLRWITEATYKRCRTEDDEKWLKGDRS